MRDIEKVECLEKLGDLFKAARGKYGLTQTEVASRAGIAQAHYSMIENGKRDAEFITIVKICQTLHIDLTDFISNYL